MQNSKKNNSRSKYKKSKNHLNKLTIFILIFLVTCIFAISFFKKNKTIIIENAINSSNNLSEFTIFDDIKILVNKDAFSHDSIMEEEINNEVALYLKKNIKNGDTIIDVSYGIGIYSLLMAKLSGLSGRVYVYNPYNKYSQSIEASAKANNFQDRIFITTIGISDHTYNGLLVYKNNFPLMSGKLEKDNYTVPNGYSAMIVKVSSLDEQLPNFQNINILKINANGDEGNIIDGSINLIKKSDKIKIISSFNKSLFSGYKSIERLILLGFQLFLIQKNGDIKQISISELKKNKQKSYILLQKTN